LHSPWDRLESAELQVVLALRKSKSFCVIQQWGFRNVCFFFNTVALSYYTETPELLGKISYSYTFLSLFILTTHSY
jgi:hypothetical protein